MSTDAVGSENSASISARSLSELSEIKTIRVGVDLVSAARRNLGLLRTVAGSQWIHLKPVVIEAIRRYEKLWMPLIADLTAAGSPVPMVLPPFDVEWVWFCHTLNPAAYREYCETKFSKLIGKPAIFDEENEEYALIRCKEIWVKRYPLEPFESEASSDWTEENTVMDEDLYPEVAKQRFLYSIFSEPYRPEVVYLIAARQRYQGFLHLLKGSSDQVTSLVPASDILLMWLTHQSHPTVYAEDVKELEVEMGKLVPVGRSVNHKELKETKHLWEENFDQPYEKAGGGIVSVRAPIHWEPSDTDVNTKYKSMMPRFLLEVCVFVGLKYQNTQLQQDMVSGFLRLRMARAHKELKLDEPVSKFTSETWHKAWHLYCEFGTKGVMVELRRLGGCFKGSSTHGTVTIHWNDLLRAPSLTLERKVDQHVRIISSVTPPVQAPYLLKCVPDRVTDDSGAMVSDVILRLNQYRPQEGRWLSRTVLDHVGRECFVIRIRVGGGFWRRGGETPSAVKWEERIVEIREGSWSYVAGSIGRGPEKVVGTAAPKEPREQWKAAWKFSTGDELMINWDSSASLAGLNFCLKTQSSETSVQLLKGRKMQYEVRKRKPETGGREIGYQGEGEEDEAADEEGFVTLVRSTEDDTTGRATALLNWKLLIVELLPEEDAVLVLLVCVCILRSVSEMKKEDVGSLLIRRRLKEGKVGLRDWGSVTLHPSSSSASPSPFLQPWHWNAEAVMASEDGDHIQPSTHSAAEGGGKLYKQVIIT